MQTNLQVKTNGPTENLTRASYYLDKMNMEAVLGELKPILRLIVQSLAYVHMVDSLVVYSYTLLWGNAMLRALCKVPLFFRERSPDGEHSIAVQLLTSQAAALLAVTLIVLLLYEDSFLKLLYQFARFTRSEHSFTFNGEQEVSQLLKELLSAGGLHIANYVAISVTSLIFTYTMILFARYIDTLQLLITEEEEGKSSYT